MTEQDNIYKTPEMQRYNKATTAAQDILTAFGFEETNLYGVLLDQKHPLATSKVFSEAREAWADAADICGNPEMVTKIREIEITIQTEKR